GAVWPPNVSSARPHAHPLQNRRLRFLFPKAGWVSRRAVRLTRRGGPRSPVRDPRATDERQRDGARQARLDLRLAPELGAHSGAMTTSAPCRLRGLPVDRPMCMSDLAGSAP